MEAIMRVVKSLENSGILVKGVSKTIKNEAKFHKGGFLSMLTGATLLEKLLSELIEKGVIAAGEITIRAGEVAIKARHDF